MNAAVPRFGIDRFPGAAYTTRALGWLEAGLGGKDVMTLATTATVGSNDDARAARGRSQSAADVNRWVAMIDAELRGEDSPAEASRGSVAVTLEFGRAAIDLIAQPLKTGDTVRLDQLADEPIDVVVDDRPIARGEVVIVDGRLGVRIVELLLLAVACLVLATPTSLAQERPRERTATTLFEDDQPQLLETPFGPTRTKRSQDRIDFSADALRPTVDVNRRESSAERTTTRLSPRSSEREADRANGDGAMVRPSWSATVWPLLFVVGLIVIGARWLKSRSPAAVRGLPNEAFEVLGRKVIDARTSVVVARTGSRLLVLNLSPHGLRTLAEITDPVEVDCLSGLCRATPRDQSLVETFRSMLHKPTNPKTASAPLSNSFDERLASRIMTARADGPVRSEVRP